jgi:hypothetical protein
VTDNFEAKVDELYQLPLEEFTKARNALAKTLSGDRKRGVASLAKPTVPMWAINQLYWKDPSTYKALIDAAEKLRAAHRALLGGKKVDLRKPDELHRAALERAARKTTDLLAQAAGHASEPARETIRRALATLPGDEQAGRLTREPEPAGFNLFAGVKPRPAKASAAQPKPERASAQSKRSAVTERGQSRREQQLAEREQAQVERERQKAERDRAAALVRTRRELKSAQREAERATFAVRKAESELAKARARETTAARQLHDAERRLARLEETRD